MSEVLEKRTRNSKTHSLGGRKYSWDGSIGSIHYEDNGWQEIDNEFLPVAPPWDWEMIKAGYHIRVKEDFTAGQIIQFEKQDETVEFQPMALEWTNDLDQVQPVAMPNDVVPVITNPVVDLLSKVGVPSHQGTIRWNDAYGSGLDFQWKCTPSKLTKILEVDSLTSLPVPEQYIIDGGNPALRLNLIFDPSNDLDIYVDGQEWDKKQDTQTFNTIEFRKDGEVLWGFMPLRYWDSSNTEDAEKQSIATLEKRGNSLYISIKVPYSWLQSATFPVFIDTDVDEQVGAGADDGLVYGADGLGDPRTTSDTFNNALGYTSIGCADASAGYRRASFSRFTTVAISGTIDTADITFTGQYGESTSVEFVIEAFDEDNAAAPVDGADFISRDFTTASVTWDFSTTWTNNSEFTSPEIKTVLQELVDRGGWSSGNNLVICVIDDLSQSVDQRRSPYSYDGDNGKGAKLHIEYTAVAGDTAVAPTPIDAVGETVLALLEKGTLAVTPTAIDAVGEAVLSLLEKGDWASASKYADAWGEATGGANIVITGLSVAIVPATAEAVGDTTLNKAEKGPWASTSQYAEAVGEAIIAKSEKGAWASTSKYADAWGEATGGANIAIGIYDIVITPTAISGVGDTASRVIFRGNIVLTALTEAVGYTAGPAVVITSPTVLIQLDPITLLIYSPSGNFKLEADPELITKVREAVVTAKVRAGP